MSSASGSPRGPLAAAIPAARRGRAPGPDADVAFAGPAAQAELVRRREVRPRELVELVLARIAELDSGLNAFRAVLPERALAEADQAEARVGAGERRPLLGVPVAIKDDVAVAGLPLTRGTSAVDDPAPADGELVARLRAAGAIVVGVTNVPELTLWGFTETQTNGATRNPWDRHRTPGGSSGGSASAVAAGLVPLATASDGAGSIRIPAALCGVFGLKVQRGRLGWGDGAERWNGMAVPGVLARTVADTALAYEALTGLAWTQAAAHPPGRLRVAVALATPPGIPERMLDRERREAVVATGELLRTLGHDVHEHELPLTVAMASRVAVRYLAGAAEEARDVAHPERLERRTRQMIALGRAAERVLPRARAAEGADAATINAIFDHHDLLLTPAVATPPVPIGTWEGRNAVTTWHANASRYPFLALWNHLGNPAASLPAGFDSLGLPLAVQLVARPEGEETLLSVAAQLEQARPWADHRPPVS
jgi:amidase